MLFVHFRALLNGWSWMQAAFQAVEGIKNIDSWLGILTRRKLGQQNPEAHGSLRCIFPSQSRLSSRSFLSNKPKLWSQGVAPWLCQAKYEKLEMRFFFSYYNLLCVNLGSPWPSPPLTYLLNLRFSTDIVLDRKFHNFPSGSDIQTLTKLLLL